MGRAVGGGADGEPAPVSSSARQLLGSRCRHEWAWGTEMPTVTLAQTEPPTPVVVLEAEIVTAAAALSCKEVVSALWDEWGRGYRHSSCGGQHAGHQDRKTLHVG